MKIIQENSDQVLKKLKDFDSAYKYGSDYTKFVEGIAKLLSTEFNMKMTSIFMDSGKAFTQDAVFGANDGKELKLSVMGGGNFEELIASRSEKRGRGRDGELRGL